MKTKLIAIAAALLLVTLPAVAVAADAAMQSVVKSGTSAAAVGFSRDDFVSRVSPEYTLKGIVIASLPAEDAGTLYRGERKIFTGEAVTEDALDTLSFVPASNTNLSATFTFLPVFNEEDAPLEQVSVGLNLLGKDNRPPTAQSFSAETCKNVALIKPFMGSDPDGDPLTYKITGKPKRGSVEILGDGTFKYTPYENKTGKDQIGYTAADSFGNESAEAKIDIVIEKSPTRVTYADMDGNPAYFAALKLAGEGIFTGEMMGGSYYFNPKTEMTRGEFIALMVTSLGLETVNTSAAPRTGFADDMGTPSWVKPYAVAALKAGAISGAPTGDGRLALLSENLITRAEGAVLVNKLCKLENTGIVPVFADRDSVPVWAAQAVSNAGNASLLTPFADGTIRLSDAITREQAAQIAYDAMKYTREHAEKTGFLAWAFG
ncbi:hypothetical protein FACS18949_05700 [Clostridia bacterium]|nr:hypothetical protein FACS18949_05700 [Clostridia bacterium]